MYRMQGAGQKVMQMFIGSRRGARDKDAPISLAALPAPKDPSVQVSIAGGELLAVARFEVGEGQGGACVGSGDSAASGWAGILKRVEQLAPARHVELRWQQMMYCLIHAVVGSSFWPVPATSSL
jgi:hypothetical protein